MIQVFNVGGNANNALTTGVFHVNGNNAASNQNRNISTQLAVRCGYGITPSLRGEYVDPIQVGRATEHLGEQQQ
jgi:hypothetical protein